MKVISQLLAFAAFLSLLFEPVAADCKYFKNADGFPLGIVPSVTNITAHFQTPQQQNATFTLYIEAEFGTTTAFGCNVELSVENETFALRTELSNYTLETGFGYIERPITVMMTPANLVNFPDEIRYQIKITDVDQPFNYAVLPIKAYFEFARQKPSPSSAATAATQPQASFMPFEPTKPASNATGLNDVFGNVQDSTSKYLIAIIAFFFLAALLWVGFNSLQRE